MLKNKLQVKRTMEYKSNSQSDTFAFLRVMFYSFAGGRKEVKRDEVRGDGGEAGVAAYLDPGPVRRWRAAAPGRRPPPETPCASSSAPAAQRRINRAERETEGPVRTGGFFKNLHKNPDRIWFRILKRLIGRARFLRDPRWRLLCIQNQIKPQ